MRKEILKKIAHIALSNYRAVLAIFLIFLILSFVVVGRLEFKTDIFGLIQKREGPLKLFLDNVRDFGTLDHLFFMLTREEGTSIQELLQAAESMAGKLREARVDGERALARVQFQILEGGNFEGMKPIFRFFLENPELFLDQEDIPALSRKFTHEAIGGQVRQNKAILLSQASTPLREFIALDPHRA